MNDYSFLNPLTPGIKEEELEIKKPDTTAEMIGKHHKEGETAEMIRKHHKRASRPWGSLQK